MDGIGDETVSEIELEFKGDEYSIWSLIEVGNYLVAGEGATGGPTVEVWDIRYPSAPAAVYDGHAGQVWSLDSTGEGLVISGSDDGTVDVWDPVDISTTFATHDGHQVGVTAVRVLNGDLVASGDQQGSIHLWSIENPSDYKVFSGHNGRIRAIDQLADGRVASASDDGTVQVWDTSDPGASASIVYRSHAAPVYVVRVLNDGSIASGGGDGVVRIWIPGDGQNISEIVSYEGHPAGLGIWSIVQLPDGRILSTDNDNGEDWATHIWSVESLPTANYLPRYTSSPVTLLRDGRIATVGFPGVLVFPIP